MKKAHSKQTPVYSRLQEIADALVGAGIPVSRLWERAGVSQSNWSRWSRGERMPSAAGFVALEQAFKEIMEDAA